MAVPFPEAQLEALIYMVLGSLITLVATLTYYIKKLHSQLDGTTSGEEEHESEEKPEIDEMGLSKRAEDILSEVMEEPELQSNLPSKLEVSKATVSNGVSELKERGLIKRKKKANTYLIEPDMDRIEEEEK